MIVPLNVSITSSIILVASISRWFVTSSNNKTFISSKANLARFTLVLIPGDNSLYFLSLSS